MPSTTTASNATQADEVFLEGLRFYGYHGVNPEERILGQRFEVDVAILLDLQRAGESDELAETVSYSDLYKLVRRIVEGEPRNLLEAVAEAIAAEALKAFPPVRSVNVTVRKPEAPLKGAILDAAGVRISRTRAQTSSQT
jgi:dihydroneopterin aldolase